MSKQQNGSPNRGGGSNPSRAYRTLPSAFRRSDESRRSSKGSVKSGAASGATSPVSSSSSSTTTTSSSAPTKNDFFSGIADKSGLMNNLGSLISGKMDSFLGNFKTRGSKGGGGTQSPPPRSSSATDSMATMATSLTSVGIKSSASASVTGKSKRSQLKEMGATPPGGGGGGFKLGTFKLGDASSACVSELIEMTRIEGNLPPPPPSEGDTDSTLDDSFAEGDVEQVGLGHVFKPVGTFNPTWCDLCRDLVWGLYDTGASRCVGCHLTCHVKCQSKIKLNCQANSQLVSLSGLLSRGLEAGSTTTGGLEPLLIPTNDLEVCDKDSSTSSTSSADELDRDESTMANISTLRDEEYSNSRTLPASISHGGRVATAAGSDSEEEGHSDDDDHKTLCDISRIEDLTVDEGIDDLIQDEEDEGRSGASTPRLDATTPQTTPPLIDFEQAIQCYNKHYPIGQETVAVAQESEVDGGKLPPSNCRGYIRVALSLRRPIHVAAGTRPPSIYNLTSASTATLTSELPRTLTSFYLPQDTVRALHLTSLTTVYDVIRSLLGKFRVVDNPHKFALYEKTTGRSGSKSTFVQDTMARMKLRKMGGEERPLLLALSRSLEEDTASVIPGEVEETASSVSNCCYFVLQENDPGEITWDSFTYPELRNFLLILDREEAWYKKRIHEKYEVVLQTMQALAEQKRPLSPDDPNKGSVEPSSKV